MFAALVLGQPDWFVFLALALTAVAAVALIVAIVKPSPDRKNNMRLMDELAVLREENALLQERIDETQVKPSGESDHRITRSTHS